MNLFSDCLIQESKAIKNAAQNLDPIEVKNAVDLLLKCSNLNGKLIITGVGKSGIVARKIAATFSSIGLMSIYLNPLDALHGDLGVAKKNDLSILFSLLNFSARIKDPFDRSIPYTSLEYLAKKFVN